MVLLILAGIWAAVLIPPILRARAESSPADSIGDFRRQLRVLQRTGPQHAPHGGETATAVPLRPVPSPRAMDPGGDWPALRPGGPGVAGQGLGSPRPRQAGGGPAPVGAAAKRARTVRRRRDVLFTLLMGMGTTFVLAMVVSSSALWMLHALMDGLFLGFLAMLVRMRAVEAEKEMKLRLLPQPHVRPQPAPVLAFRRSATN